MGQKVTDNIGTINERFNKPNLTEPNLTKHVEVCNDY